MSGLEVLEEIIRIDPDLVVVIISAFASIENAVDATKSGAFDFVTKPFKNEELLLVVKNGLKKRSLEIENRHLKRTLNERVSFENIVGKSEPMQQVFDLITQVAPRRSTVLIAGSCSPRSDHAFVAVNSGSIPSDLLESELFGHVKGAFTGAISSKKGLFEVADGGTIFLDEVGTLPLETQSRLLRVIQEREFRQVGGLENIRVDVRIIAATNSKENDRPDCYLDPSTLQLLIECDWPGNVRELENVMERAVVLAPDDGRITQALFPREILDSSSLGVGHLSSLENGSTLKDLVLEYEKKLIMTALQKADWSQKKAASLLRINRSTLNEKLKRLQIKIP
jgi:DNA-binding NtrC family response regulator